MIPEDWPKWKKTAVVSGTLSGGLALFTPVIEWGLSNFGISFGWLTWLSDSVVATIEVPVWGVGLFLIIVVLIYYGWRRYEEANEPDWTNYTSDELRNLYWTWEWDGDRIDNLQPLCPEEDCRFEVGIEGRYPSDMAEGPTELLNDSYLIGSTVYCRRCEYEEDWNQAPDALKQFVKQEIRRRRRIGEFEA